MANDNITKTIKEIVFKGHKCLDENTIVYSEQAVHELVDLIYTYKALFEKMCEVEKRLRQKIDYGKS